MTEVIKMRATLTPEQAMAGPGAAERALEHHAILAARRGEIELDPGWRIVNTTQETLTSRYSDEQAIFVTGEISGARKPRTTAGDV